MKIFIYFNLKKETSEAICENTLYNWPESTKQLEQTLRAKAKIFFKSENLKKCF